MPASLFVFMGLIGSGKSTLARAFAAEFSLSCYNTDIVRKELAGKAPDSRQGATFNQGIYSPEFSRLTYDALRDHARNELDLGRSVVLDGSYQKRTERGLLIECTAQCGAPIYFILCQCDEGETKRRLDIRAKDPGAVSDGTWEIYQQQKKSMEFPHEIPAAGLLVIDSSQPVSFLLAELKDKLAHALT
ncbi:MAG: AAA family ATPase [Pseudomonadota bacterium]